MHKLNQRCFPTLKNIYIRDNKSRTICRGTFMPLCFIVDRQRGDASCCHNDDHNTSRSPAPSVIFPQRHKCGKKKKKHPWALSIFHRRVTLLCAGGGPSWWKRAPGFQSALEIKASIFMAPGEELFLMSAACGFPSTHFDLFLESNVMIVADFENLETHFALSNCGSLLCTALSGRFGLLFAALLFILRDV